MCLMALNSHSYEMFKKNTFASQGCIRGIGHKHFPILLVVNRPSIKPLVFTLLSTLFMNGAEVCASSLIQPLAQLLARVLNRCYT
jgi:hypothetical protein